MTKLFQCKKCGKHYGKQHSVEQHISDFHNGKGEWVKAKKQKKHTDAEQSLADISVEAYLKKSMGEHLDPLEESLINE